MGKASAAARTVPLAFMTRARARELVDRHGLISSYTFRSRMMHGVLRGPYWYAGNVYLGSKERVAELEEARRIVREELAELEALPVVQRLRELERLADSPKQKKGNAPRELVAPEGR